MLTQFRWCGYVIRLPDDRILQHLFCQLNSWGGQRKRYKDQFRVNLEACNFDYVSWKTVSVVRSQWRKRCSSAMKQFEEQRLEYIKSRRVYSARQTSLSRLFPLLVTTAALAVGHVLPISVSKTSSIDSSYRRLSPPSPM